MLATRVQKLMCAPHTTQVRTLIRNESLFESAELFFLPSAATRGVALYTSRIGLQFGRIPHVPYAL